ncbi:N2,N2-dimethylguanosine tRNA methyltransferase [Diplocarpon rosae]|nr:N2,N2-dimethylguanosine tRNA methyltransferase [Diplocarpon rosae]
MDRRASTASQDTFISLQQLDPSPIDTPPELDQQLVEDLPSLPKSSTTLGLSGSGHSSVYYLTRLQKYSSYAFTVFASFHITNTSLIPLITRSVPASESYLLLTRPYYQSFPLEPLLVILPIATHILSGLALRIHRRNANLARFGGAHLSPSERLRRGLKIWPKLSWSSLSGYALTPLVLGHAFVNRLLPWVYEGGSSSVGLGFVSHGFAKHPVAAWIGYAGLVGVGTGHFVWGIVRWNGWVPVGSDKKAKRRWWTINAISSLVTALWMAGGLGVVGRGGLTEDWIGKGYDTLYAKVPLVNF